VVGNPLLLSSVVFNSRVPAYSMFFQNTEPKSISSQDQDSSFIADAAPATEPEKKQVQPPMFFSFGEERYRNHAAPLGTCWAHGMHHETPAAWRDAGGLVDG
jgi:hypothetical protein